MIPALLAALTVAASPGLRREAALDFAVDDTFQAAGGVQYFYELATPTPTPPAASPLARFRAMDAQASGTDDYYVVMSRLVYTVDRDVSYFTEARARDVTYLRQVAPEMGVRREPDGAFMVTRTPSNRFRLSWYDAPAPSEPELKAFFAVLPPGAQPASVVVQKNSDFSRVMGWRTAERSLTFTAHIPRGPGRTLVVVCTQSLLYHLPPFFLGGKDRIFRESVDGAATLIEQLRGYQGP